MARPGGIAKRGCGPKRRGDIPTGAQRTWNPWNTAASKAKVSQLSRGTAK
jgi:hypothetical protein